MRISELIKAANARVLTELEKDIEVRISTDTRTIQKGDFYLPLKGANFDGEKFITQALEKGASGTFCTGENYPKANNFTVLKVDNTLDAYLQLANYRRNKQNYTVVAVTGSSGKTTTKELIASVLSENFKTFKTPLNHNNEVGLCRTIFEAPDDTEILVLEMGMRGLGEIEVLSKCAEPDITVISNVGTAHIGRLGSRENIAKAKCEIVKYQRGNVFISHDDELIRKTVEFKGDKIFYSMKDVKILEKNEHYSKFEYTDNVYELNVGGDYNIENSLAAINTGFSLGMDVDSIKQGLKKYTPIEKRWEMVNSGGYEIINDSYNANPESMKVFVDTVLELYTNPVLVLGDMGELGDDEIKYHKELGEYINSHQNLKQDVVVLSVGSLSKYITDEIKNCCSVHFETIESLVDFIKHNVPADFKLFLKASRSMKLERIIEEIGRKSIGKAGIL